MTGSTDDRPALEHARLRWPPEPAPEQRRPDARSLYVYLLDVDDDLADEFDVRSRLGARQLATARVLEADIGENDLGPLFEASRGGFGLLILDGLLAIAARVGERTATELVGAGDLLQPPSRRADDLLERSDDCRVLCPARLALLDAEFADRVRPWPQIVQALIRRAGRRIQDIDALRAITAQPRLELRLDLLLWHLAGRWGRVEPAGIRLTLPLTHRLLGHLVAAERPSISHALARLAHAGLVTGAAGDLHLHGSIGSHLEALVEPTTHLTSRRRGAEPTRRQIA